MSWTEAWQAAPPHTSVRDLRSFGIVMALAFGAIGGLFLWRDRLWAVHLFWPSGGFLLLALILPKVLLPVRRGWLAFSEILGSAVTRIILFFAFYLLITPFGILKRWISGDTLGLRPDPEATTYWVDVEPEGPGARPDKPF